MTGDALYDDGCVIFDEHVHLTLLLAMGGETSRLGGRLPHGLAYMDVRVIGLGENPKPSSALFPSNRTTIGLDAPS